MWVLSALFVATPLRSQPSPIRFDRISIEQGLSQSAVNAILQDQRGFIWVGTEEALNRYDGYGFQIVRHDLEDPDSISHGPIMALLEDREGGLWIGTDGGGLSRWDHGRRRATRFVNDAADPTTLSNDRVRALFEDRQGALWIGTEGGLNRFERDGERFTRFNHDPAETTSLAADIVYSLREDRDGNLWVATVAGLDRLDPDRRVFTHYRHHDGDPSSISHDLISSVHVDQEGRLWVGTSGGLNRFEPENGRFVRYRHDPRDPRSLVSDQVRAVLQDADGGIWVGTTVGLSRWRPESDDFVHYRHDPTDETSLGAGVVHVIYQDRGGVLWVGTKFGGLSKFNATTGFFPHYHHDPRDPSSLTLNAVTTFEEERDGTFWIGTFGGGLDRLHRERGVIERYRHLEGDPSSLAGDRVMSLLVDSRNVLWVGTRSEGLDRFERSNRSFVHYRPSDGDPTAIGGSGIVVIFEDRAGVLWFGTYRGGLSRYDRERDSFVSYRHDPRNATTLSSDIVTALHEDADGVLWVGTEGGGLNRFDRSLGSFTHFEHNPSDRTSLSHNIILSLHEDADGVFWIGTLGGGLNRWLPAARHAHRGVFRRYTTDDGLPNDTVYAILEDGEGYLWMSTNRGLTKFDPRSERFRNYDVSQGLQSNEFNVGAYLKTSSGELLFGGIEGFNLFRPERIRDNTHVPPVVLTSFLKLNQPVDLGRDLSELGEVAITHRDYVVSFEFAALDYSAPGKNQYAYRLEGFDDNWIELGTLRRATYTNLNPGHYVLRVKGSNNDGVWNEQGLALGVRVIPPWWRTWWAYTLYLLLAAGAIFAYTRAQAEKLEREAEYSRKLEREVAARTRELARRNEQLEEANRNLERASLTDSLTGLRNRRFVITHLEEEIALAERRHETLKRSGHEGGLVKPDFLFLMFDLDGLKQINDNFGHATGDLLLCQVRDLLERICRKSDTLVRWGGDEFLIVGRDADPTTAELLAERVRSAVEQHEFDLEIGKPVRLSCSLGFAFHPFIADQPQLLNWEQVLAVADRALYAAKKSGRNSWVGIFSTGRTAPDDLFKQIYDAPDQMAGHGVIRFRTSLGHERELLWEM